MRYNNFDKYARLAGTLLITILASFYMFPVGFRGLPPSLNSKQILGVVGVMIYVLRCIRTKSFSLSHNVFVAFLISCVFSVWCYFSCVFNGTSDYAYASYVLSFAVWMGGAFALCEIIRARHGSLDLELVTRYVVLACVAQCVFVLLVDNVPSFQHFVDTYFIQDTTAKRLGRKYGIGCSLDSGGVRLCMGLVLIAHQFATNRKVTDSKVAILLYAIAFLVIAVIGNMVARTTSVGMLLALGYIFVTVGWAHRATLTVRQLRFQTIFFLLLAAVVGASIYYYTRDPAFRQDIRFAFEVFFNFVENGEVSTSSSDVLMERMWIWPWTTEGWIYGYGLFEWSNWTTLQTDIGYCRFTLYCGLIGLSIFSIYFIYNAFVVSRKFKNARLFALILLAMTFVIWIKVSTDIFQLYALLLCLPSDKEDKEEEPEE